jgi:hypothetical protein
MGMIRKYDNAPKVGQVVTVISPAVEFFYKGHDVEWNPGYDTLVGKQGVVVSTRIYHSDTPSEHCEVKLIMLDNNSPFYCYPEWLETENKPSEKLTLEKIKELFYDLGFRGLSDKQRETVINFVNKVCV